MSHRALKRALKLAGNNQTLFARTIGTSQQLVSYWMREKKKLPAEYVLATEREFGVSRHDLRPDIYPREEVAA